MNATVVRTEREELLSYISDAHKDAYGSRPHGRYSACSVEELREVAEELSEAVGRTIAREAEERASAAVAFEARVADVIATGAGDRATALRWIFQADEVLEDIETYGGSYGGYHYGVAHNYFDADGYLQYPYMRHQEA